MNGERTGEIMEIMAAKITWRSRGEAFSTSFPDPCERGQPYRCSHHAPVGRALWQRRSADQIAVWSHCLHVS